MNLFKKNKHSFSFNVCLVIADLSDVPYLNGLYFAKCRLLQGGKYSDVTERSEVSSNQVFWGKAFDFNCRIMADLDKKVLEACLLRISVRKECKGGRSFEKIGFMDINLAEFAKSSGEGDKRQFILNGYGANNGSSRHRTRPDNSLCRVQISMQEFNPDSRFPLDEFIVPDSSARVAVIASGSDPVSVSGDNNSFAGPSTNFLAPSNNGLQGRTLSDSNNLNRFSLPPTRGGDQLYDSMTASFLKPTHLPPGIKRTGTTTTTQQGHNRSASSSGTLVNSSMANYMDTTFDKASLHSNSSGHGSLPRMPPAPRVAVGPPHYPSSQHQHPTSFPQSCDEIAVGVTGYTPEFEPCHSRNLSSASAISGYVSNNSHSRQSSTESGQTFPSRHDTLMGTAKPMTSHQRMIFKTVPGNHSSAHQEKEAFLASIQSLSAGSTPSLSSNRRTGIDDPKKSDIINTALIVDELLKETKVLTCVDEEHEDGIPTGRHTRPHETWR